MHMDASLAALIATQTSNNTLHHGKVLSSWTTFVLAVFDASRSLLLEHTLGGCGELDKLVGGADWPLRKVASTVGASLVQMRVDAVGAPCALECANVGVVGLGREVAVTPFAVGTELEHATLKQMKR